MIQPDRPPLPVGHPGQDDPSQLEPSTDPLILTLALDPADQARLDRLRDAHFPPERNFLAAHVTMFHHLPGPNADAIAATIRHMTAIAPFAVRIARLQSLGRGVALTLESPDLLRLRAALARIWADHLTPQDRQAYRPHVTIQNKVDPAIAKRLFADLSVTFTPWTVEATGLALWHYRGGPWVPAATFPFKPAAAAPPARHHR